MTTTPKTESAAKKDVSKLQRAIVDGLEDVKAQDIQVFDTEHLTALFERVIVASGTSNRQTKAIAASVRDKVREAGFPKPRIEGEENGEWIIVDCGAAVAHIMQPTIRQYYRLEELWGDTPVRVKLGAPKPAAAPAAKVPVKTAARRAAKAEAESETAAPQKSGSRAAAKPAGKTSTRAPAKTTARKPAARTTTAAAPAPASAPSAARKPATRTTAASAKPAVKAPAKPATKAPAKAAIKTLIVKPREDKNKPAAKKGDPRTGGKTSSRAPAKAGAKPAVTNAAPARTKSAAAAPAKSAARKPAPRKPS